MPGHEARAKINVKVVNDPPKITCSSVPAIKNTPLAISVSDCVSDPNHDPVTMDLDGAAGGSVERVAGVWYFVPTTNNTAGGSFMLHASDGDNSIRQPQQRVLVTIATLQGKFTLDMPDSGKTRTIASGASLRLAASAVDPSGKPAEIIWNFGDKTPTAHGTKVAHRFRDRGKYTVTAMVNDQTKKAMKVVVLRRAVEVVGAPKVIDGVLQVTVRTRAAGQLLLKADSRSQTIKVPAGLTRQTLHIQVTTGPLVRLTLRITPNKKTPSLQGADHPPARDGLAALSRLATPARPRAPCARTRTRAPRPRAARPARTSAARPRRRRAAARPRAAGTRRRR